MIIFGCDSIFGWLSVKVEPSILDCQVLAFHRPVGRDRLENEAFVLYHVGNGPATGDTEMVIKDSLKEAKDQYSYTARTFLSYLKESFEEGNTWFLEMRGDL